MYPNFISNKLSSLLRYLVSAIYATRLPVNHTMALPPEYNENAARNQVSTTPSHSIVLLEDNESRVRREFLTHGLPLYYAAMNGDWKAAELIFNKDPRWITAAITERKDTALHIATAAKHVDFVTKLVNRMDTAGDRLLSKTTLGNTAFCIAASSGEVEIAEVMVAKNRELPNIRGSVGMTPLHMAILFGHKAMAKYLMDNMRHYILHDRERIELVTSAIQADFYDVAYDIVKDYPHLASCRNSTGKTVLHTLSQKRFPSQTRKPIIWKLIMRCCTGMVKDEGEQQVEYAIKLTEKVWNEVIKMKESEIWKLIEYPSRLIFDAAEIGNVDFLVTLILKYPDVIWRTDDKRKTIFHIAIEYRQNEVFKLIHEIGAIKDLVAVYMDDNGNNMLHLAAKSAPADRLNSVSGAALQMQQELLWFEAVKKVVQPNYAVAKNFVEKVMYDQPSLDNSAQNQQHKTNNKLHKTTYEWKKTPQDIFTEQHEGLRTKGEEWMKKTAESCTLVATLITTVVFTAAFTLPGGNDDKNGSPILLQQLPFKIFAISNAVSLFASATSILMFLSILTSRYAEKDFLKVLPFKLMIGLTSLFVSIATMMVTFTSAFFITFQRDTIWIPGPIALLAAFPVLLFAYQQYPLLSDIYRSTYRSSTLFQRSNERKLRWKTT